MNRNQWVTPIVSIERHARETRGLSRAGRFQSVSSSRGSLAMVVLPMAAASPPPGDSNLTYNAAYIKGSICEPPRTVSRGSIAELHRVSAVRLPAPCVIQPIAHSHPGNTTRRKLVRAIAFFIVTRRIRRFTSLFVVLSILSFLSFARSRAN